jgi:lysophospholipase L1-like esterase
MHRKTSACLFNLVALGAGLTLWMTVVHAQPAGPANGTPAPTNPGANSAAPAARAGRRGGGAGGAGARGGAPAAPGAAAPTATDFKFSFGNGAAPDGFTAIAPGAAYAPGKAGFDMGTNPPALPDGGVGSTAPFAFSTDIAEGNYKVTVTLGDKAGESTTTLLAETRRLMIEKVHTDAGQFATVDFIVNVRSSRVPPPPTNAPGGSEVRLNFLDQPMTWDDKLTLEFTNSRPCVQKIEIHPVTVPTIFIMGDSTVTDQPRDPGASWGQMLPVFFKDTVAVANHATSGETMKSSITGLRLDKVLSQMKKGDYLLCQFGHNDEKASWPQTYVEPETTFKAYMSVYIAEARRRGATPVMISMMERKNGINGNTHGGFPQAYEELAVEQKVAFIDNWKNSKTMYAAMGTDVDAAFNDATHHKDYGAYEIAKLVAQGLRDNNLPIAKELRDDFKPFDPAHPDKAADFKTPLNISGNGNPPRGN